MIRQASTEIEVATPGQGLHEVTAELARWVAGRGMTEGLLTVFCRHTSASLLIQENAAPEARSDLEAYFARIAPESGVYEHDDEGPDDMPAHLRAALTQTQLSIPLIGGGARRDRCPARCRAPAAPPPPRAAPDRRVMR